MEGSDYTLASPYTNRRRQAHSVGEMDSLSVNSLRGLPRSASTHSMVGSILTIEPKSSTDATTVTAWNTQEKRKSIELDSQLQSVLVSGLPEYPRSSETKGTAEEGTVRWFILQVLLLVIFVVLTLKHFRFVSLFADNCYDIQMHNVPYCTVVDFILSIIVCVLAVGIFLHKRTWVISSSLNVALRLWHDYESVYGVVLALFVIVVIALYAYYMANLAENFRARIDRSPCHQPPEKIAGFVRLANDLSSVFEQHDLDYFMDYGTLIGAMRYNGPIPWDHDVDLGILESSMIEHGVTPSDIVNDLQQRGLVTYYDIWNGLIRAKTPDGIADADIMIWREDMFGNGMMKRVGMEAWFAPIAYSIFNDFPKEAVAPRNPGEKLPQRMFGGVLLREPVDPVAFLATRYRSSWWKEVRPSHCLAETYTVFDGSRPPYTPFQDPEHVARAIAAQLAADEAGSGKDAATELKKIILHHAL